MGSNLAKAPLIAICYAALLRFVSVFVPFTGEYGAMWGVYGDLLDTLWLLLYCVWICVAAALVYAAASAGGAKLTLIMAGCFVLNLFVTPLTEPLVRGEVSGRMAQWDTLVYLIIGAVATLLMLLLCMLLYKVEAPPPSRQGLKPKFRMKNLLLTIVVLPFVYLVLWFVFWYFLGWRDELVRAFWNGSMQSRGMASAFVDLMLDMPGLIPLALLRGLLYGGAGILLVTQMAGKRMLYIIAHTMLLLGMAVGTMVPTPAVPESVQWMLVAQYAAQLTPFGVISAILIHRTVELPAPAPATAPPRGPGQRPQPAPARR